MLYSFSQSAHKTQVLLQNSCPMHASVVSNAVPNHSLTHVYSSSAANPAARTPTLYPTTLPAPVDCAGLGPVVVELGATLGPPVCVETVKFPLVVGIAAPVLAAVALAVITVVMATVPLACFSELLHRMLPSWTGFVAMSAGEVELKDAEPGSVPFASLNAWQVRDSRATPEERRSSRPQMDFSSGCVLVRGLCRVVG
jgi:hypothetical protein